MNEEAIRQHKRMAMGENIMGDNMKKGGKVKVAKYAKGGQVNLVGSNSGEPAEVSHQEGVNKIGAYPESKIRNLPAKGSVKPLTKATGPKIATMKKGGHAHSGKMGIALVLAPMKKSTGRGR